MIYLSMASLAGKRRLLAAMLLCGALLPGVSASEEQPAAATDAASQAQPAAVSPKPEELVWPSPPEQPRVRYLGSINNPDDLGRKKGFWRKVWEFFRGDESEEDIVRPMSVAVDSQDRVIVADSARNRVHIFDRKTAEYSSITGTGNELLVLPIGLTVDAKDNIYVASGASRIFVFKPDGSYDHELDAMKWLGRPSGLAIDKKRQILYIADAPSHAVRVYDLVERTLLKTLGTRGEGEGEFNYPAFVAVDNAGRLYVTDAMNSRIQIFDANGNFLRAFGKKGDGAGDFAAPKGVVVDSEGHIYVADAEFDNIQIFSGNAPLLFIGTSGQAAGMFWMPTGLFMDGQDRLYVADSYNNRVQIFQYLKDTANTATKIKVGVAK